MLEFTYRASSPQMTENDIKAMEAALSEFHDLKSVVVDLDIYKSIDHFDDIPDGYSTEAPEHLHIVYVKRGWRASNKVRPGPQMILFVQRYEAMRIHRAHMNQFHGIDSKPVSDRVPVEAVYGEDEAALSGVIYEGDDDKDESDNGDEDGDGDDVVDQVPDPHQHMPSLEPRVAYARNATDPRVQGAELIAKYGATDLVGTLVKYLDKLATHLPSSAFFISPFVEFSVWHRIYLHHTPPPPHAPHRDVIRAKPPPSNSNPRLQRKGTFDVALFVNDPTAVGLHRYRAGRVRAIFALPSTLQHYCDKPLAYVELFTPFSASVRPFHHMYTTSLSLSSDGKRRARIIPLTDIVGACHLAPQFHLLDDTINLNLRPDLLAVSRRFYFNHFYTRFLFWMVETWHVATAAARHVV